MGPGITVSFNAAMKQLRRKAGQEGPLARSPKGRSLWVQRGEAYLATGIWFPYAHRLLRTAPKALDRATTIFDFALNFCRRICPNGK